MGASVPAPPMSIRAADAAQAGRPVDGSATHAETRCGQDAACTLNGVMSRPADRPDGYVLREATLADAPTLARQRRLMFDSISPLEPGHATLLEAAILRYVAQAMPAGTFRSWVVEHQGTIVSGGGLQLRTLMPRPGYVYGEPEGLIVSMWTDPEHRRRGLGRRIVEAILTWGRENGITRFTLHASDDGRPLYELYGFKPTNEMRLESNTPQPGAVTIERIS